MMTGAGGAATGLPWSLSCFRAFPLQSEPVSFDVSAEDYGRFVGRSSEPLAGQFTAWLGLDAGQHVLDVGCGPGALTAVLAATAGAGCVSAVDPAALLHGAGLAPVESAVLGVSLAFSSFEDYWYPFTLGAGPPGAYLAARTDAERSALRAACARLLPPGPFTLAFGSWAARGQVPGRPQQG
jgi:SAM-dependent methyltransferase